MQIKKDYTKMIEQFEKMEKERGNGTGIEHRTEIE